jgi:hypothetical protein
LVPPVTVCPGLSIPRVGVSPARHTKHAGTLLGIKLHSEGLSDCLLSVCPLGRLFTLAYIHLGHTPLSSLISTMHLQLPTWTVISSPMRCGVPCESESRLASLGYALSHYCHWQSSCSSVCATSQCCLLSDLYWLDVPFPVGMGMCV